MSYTKQDRVQAIRICEVAASASFRRQTDDFYKVADDLGFTHHAAGLAEAAADHAADLYNTVSEPYPQRAQDAEAAQQLREGWAP